MSLAQDQLDALELARQEKFTAHGQSGSLDLLQYEANALTDYLTIDRAWDYGERDSDGRLLPPEVQYEARIAESLLSVSAAAQIAALQHDGVIYQIHRPSPFPPQGLRRFWRFWISPQEPE